MTGRTSLCPFLPRVKFMRQEGGGWFILVGRLFVKWSTPEEAQ